MQQLSQDFAEPFEDLRQALVRSTSYHDGLPDSGIDIEDDTAALEEVLCTLSDTMKASCR